MDRAIPSIPLWLLQLPVIVVYIAANTEFYGRPSWNFSFRVLRLLVAWSLNPGIRPMDDVLSRQESEKLKDGYHVASD
jgi:hypothetical protein